MTITIKEQVALEIESKKLLDVYYQIIGRYIAQKKYGGFVPAKSCFYEGSSIERAFVNAKEALAERDGRAKLVVLSHSNSFFRLELDLSNQDL